MYDLFWIFQTKSNKINQNNKIFFQASKKGRLWSRPYANMWTQNLMVIAYNNRCQLGTSPVNLRDPKHLSHGHLLGSEHILFSQTNSPAFGKWCMVPVCPCNYIPYKGIMMWIDTNRLLIRFPLLFLFMGRLWSRPCVDYLFTGSTLLSADNISRNVYSCIICPWNQWNPSFNITQ